MKKEDIITYFDALASSWDDSQVSKDRIITRILDEAHIGEGQKLLDVACGTGVLFPFYMLRNVAKVTGIDISPKMAELAAEKFADEPKIKVICGDVESCAFEETFDSIMVYNAFPHFLDPKRLINALSSILSAGGRLSVAHSMSQEAVDAHHRGSAHAVSNGLMHSGELALLFSVHFDVDVNISDDEMYMVSGVKK